MPLRSNVAYSAPASSPFSLALALVRVLGREVRPCRTMELDVAALLAGAPNLGERGARPGLSHRRAGEPMSLKIHDAAARRKSGELLSSTGQVANRRHAVTKEALSALPTLDIGELRQQWRGLYKTQAPSNLSREILVLDESVVVGWRRSRNRHHRLSRGRRHARKRPGHGRARKPAHDQALRPHRRRDHARRGRADPDLKGGCGGRPCGGVTDTAATQQKPSAWLLCCYWLLTGIVSLHCGGLRGWRSLLRRW
jgi:hypothetical protein